MRASRVRCLWGKAKTSHYDRVSNFWKRAETTTGARLSSDSIPRHVQGYYESTNQRDGATLRWYPYKNELTVSQRRVRTVRDAVYAHYFPREYSDDERVKYVSIRTGRSEEDVAAEIYLMRRARLYAAQTIRCVLYGSYPTPAYELESNSLEMRYVLGARNAAIEMAGSDTTISVTTPALMHSAMIDVADCVDAIAKQTMYTSLQYLFFDVLVHKGVARARLPQVRGRAKSPLSHIEPCLYEFCKLRLAVLALIAKQESYVVDHAFDGGHKYVGCIVHLFPSLQNPCEIAFTNELIPLDLTLAWEWMQHYRKHHVRRNV